MARMMTMHTMLSIFHVLLFCIALSISFRIACAAESIATDSTLESVRGRSSSSLQNEAPIPAPRRPNFKFGADGHFECASIAQAYLTPNTKAQITPLLPDATNGDIATVASWADSMKNIYVWSSRLHFINVPDGTCKYNKTRDCADYTPSAKGSLTQKNACLEGAIANYTSQIATGQYNGRPLTSTQTNEALKFVIHLMGDIHQPLHCGWAGDSGGNGFTGVFINANSVNLHEVWDANIIERRDNDFKGRAGYIQWLIQQVNLTNPSATFARNVSTWQTCKDPSVKYGACTEEWAAEAIDLACTYAYTDQAGKPIRDGFNLQLPYYNRVYPILDFELARCGVRLANILNRVYDGLPPVVPLPRGPVTVLFVLKLDISTLPLNFSSLILQDLSKAATVNLTRLYFSSVISLGTGTSFVRIVVTEDDNPAVPAASTFADRLVQFINNPDSDIYLQPYASAAVAGSASNMAGGDSSSGGVGSSTGTGNSTDAGAGGAGGGGSGTDTLDGSGGGSSHLAVPVLIAIIVGVAVLILLIGVAIFCYKRGSAKGQQQNLQERMKKETEFTDLSVAPVPPLQPNPAAAATTAALPATYIPPPVVAVHRPASPPPVAVQTAPPPPPAATATLHVVPARPAPVPPIPSNRPAPPPPPPMPASPSATMPTFGGAPPPPPPPPAQPRPSSKWPPVQTGPPRS